MAEKQLALPSYSDARAAVEKETFRDRVSSCLNLISDTVTGRLWHARVLTVPVNLEPVRVAGVQVVGGDEEAVNAFG